MQLQSDSALTPREAQRLRELERIVDEGMEGFLRVGAALLEIRTGRLYRSTHERWEDYVRDRWGLSLSRANQIAHSMQTYTCLTVACPQDAPLLAEASENMLRPLSRLEPELQVAAWELVKHLEERPSGATIAEAVTTIRTAIDAGWEERERQGGAPTEALVAPSNGANGHHPAHPPRRKSDELANFTRWSRRIATWDAEAIALSDDEEVLESHLQAAQRIRDFCQAFITAIEGRLAT